jgi:hypothetical protein
MQVLTNILIILASGIPGLVVAGLAMILMLFALIRKEAGWMVFAALLLIPFAYARGDATAFGWVVRLLPLFPLGSAFAIHQDDSIFAWALPLLPFGYLIYVLFQILTGGFTGIDPVYIY